MSNAALSMAKVPAARSFQGGGVVFASTVGTALGVTPAVIAVFGDFLVPIAAEFQWSRARVSGALALVSVATALASPVAGRVADAIGARRTVLIGSVALAASIISLLWARPVPVLFYAQFAVIGVAGAVAGNMVYAKLISEWFEARRGLWIGVAGGVGNGMGATVLPVLAAILLPLVGWRGSFAAIGTVVLVLGVPIQYFLIQNAPARRTATADGHGLSAELEGVGANTALRSRDFWLLATSLPVGAGCLVALFTTLVPLLTDRGFSLGTATGVIVACSLTATVWEPTVGFLLDHTTRPRNLAPLYLLAGTVSMLGVRCHKPGQL
jgi:MFS family permease